VAARDALASHAVGILSAAVQARDWSRVLIEAERLTVEQRANAVIALQCAEALLELDRPVEATNEADTVLGHTGLGWALRTSACLVRLRALLRRGCLDSVTADAMDWCSSNLPVASKLVLLDGIACEILYRERRDFLPSAESWARTALALSPTELSLKGTLGSILVELGRHDEAEPLLRETYEQSVSPTDQRICAFYLAVIAKGRKQPEHARKLATEAKEALDQPWLITRIVREFPDV
jgi:uncharacterized protein HemY